MKQKALYMQADVNYANYLQLDKILNAQSPRGEEVEHDEMLFIVIHQVYELWFKQILHEIDYLMALLQAQETFPAIKTIKRILTILKTVVSQIDVLETLSPLEFNAFRGHLSTASGFQSYQFRELEFVLGHKRAAMVNHFSDGSTASEMVKKRYTALTLWDAFANYLHAQGYAVPEDVLNRDVTLSVKPSLAMQNVLIEVYHHDSANAMLSEHLIDLDEGLLEWRYRHVKMVERTIGAKMGTGGSSGAEYLKTTLFRPVFPDLWAIRAEL